MNRTTLIRDHNRLYKALDTLLELPGDKYRQAINSLRDDIADIDSKLAKDANEQDKTFECGSREHYQEYCKRGEHFPNEVLLTYEQFVESVSAD